MNLYLKNPSETYLLKIVLNSYNDLEEEMKVLNNNFLPLNDFIENQKAIDNLLRTYVNDFQTYEMNLIENIGKS